MRNLHRMSITVGAALAGLILLGAGPAVAGGDWNDGKIDWQSYEEGLKAAKEKEKPICLVFFTEWCPHCTNYAKVFHDPKVVEKSKEFVMIRLDKDKNAKLSSEYNPDGEYIPRTYFMTPAGTLDPALTAGRPQYKYFYNEHDPASLLAGMDRALEKMKN